MITSSVTGTQSDETHYCVGAQSPMALIRGHLFVLMTLGWHWPNSHQLL